MPRRRSASSPRASRSFTVDGLPSRTRFDLQVLAVDGDGNISGFGYGTYTVYTAAAGTTAPSQPQRLISPAGSYRRVELSWAPSTDDSGVAAYAVYRNNRQIATVTSTSYTDTLVGCSSEYYVQAIDGDGSLSAPSARIVVPGAVLAVERHDARRPRAITSPATARPSPDSVDVDATASDDVGVTKVELYVDGVAQGHEDGRARTRSRRTRRRSRDGTHWLYVARLRRRGQLRHRAASRAVTVTIAARRSTRRRPHVAIVDPTAGATVSGPVTITATASDNVGVDERRHRRRRLGRRDGHDGAVRRRAGTRRTPGPARTRSRRRRTTPRATPTDDSVTVMRPAPADTTPPTVSITSPANGASVSGTVHVQASASDDVGVAKVEFSVDGTLAEHARPHRRGASPRHVDARRRQPHAEREGVRRGRQQLERADLGHRPPPPPPDSTVPSTPSSLKALLAGTTQVVLTWAATKDNVGVVAYEVYRDGVKVGETAKTNFLDSGLAPGTTSRVPGRRARRRRQPLGLLVEAQRDRSGRCPPRPPARSPASSSTRSASRSRTSSCS